MARRYGLRPADADLDQVRQLLDTQAQPGRWRLTRVVWMM
jgi:hypothetical protein